MGKEPLYVTYPLSFCNLNTTPDLWDIGVMYLISQHYVTIRNIALLLCTQLCDLSPLIL